MGSVRVAIVGVGNCATSLIQGVEYYKDADPAGTVPGLMHVTFGDYHVSDVEFVAAFDVDAKKVGFDLSDAINNSENNTIKICDVPPTGVTVQRGHTLDGLGKYYRETIEESDAEPVDVVQVLKDAQADVLVSYLPVGSEEADKFYAQCAIDAGVAFVNALPVFIASDPEWAKKFEDAGVPIVGDDIKSQVGATITHRVMAKLFEDRGVVLDRTYQLNVGGNMDFKNMLERDRLESKKISKTQAVTSNLTATTCGRDRNVHIGPSDYVQWLDDRKWAYVRLEGRAFGDVPLNLEYKLEVWDSPNSAGIIIDAIRAAKIAKDRGIGGPLLSASSYLMKSPAGAAPRRRGPRLASRPSSAATSSAEAIEPLCTSSVIEDTASCCHVRRRTGRLGSVVPGPDMSERASSASSRRLGQHRRREATRPATAARGPPLRRPPPPPPSGASRRRRAAGTAPLRRLPAAARPAGRAARTAPPTRSATAGTSSRPSPGDLLVPMLVVLLVVIVVEVIVQLLLRDHAARHARLHRDGPRPDRADPVRPELLRLACSAPPSPASWSSLIVQVAGRRPDQERAQRRRRQAGLAWARSFTWATKPPGDRPRR